MLNALLAMFGTLAILVSIVAKLVWLRAGAKPNDIASPDKPENTLPAFTSVRSDRAGRRVQRRARQASLRRQVPCVSTKPVCSAQHSKR